MSSLQAYEGILPQVAADAYVAPGAQVIGQVVIGAASSIWPMTVVRGDIHRIRIGARTNIQDGSVLHVTHDSPYAPGGFALEVGNEVTVGHRVVLHGCTLEDGCLIGMGSIILDGARICAGAMVGAGTLVSPGKVLEGGYLWLGTPARRVRPLRQEERDYFAYSAAHYVRLAQRYGATAQEEAAAHWREQEDTYLDQ